MIVIADFARDFSGLIAQKHPANKARMDDMATRLAFLNNTLLCICLIATLILGFGMRGALAAGPVETSIFAVQGVEVDVTDTDAASAKNKALIEVQMKAFLLLAQRLGDASLAEKLGAFDEKQVLPYLKSLSIEEESISPGRYKGKLTVRFLPAKIRALYSNFGVRVAGEQGPSFLVLTIWKENGTQTLWEDNPWRQAWINLRAEQSLIPVIVPLGDLDDSGALSVTDVLSDDAVKIEKIRRHYDVQAVLIAYAEPAEGGGVHARMNGNSPLGKLIFDKIYTADSSTLQASADLAASRFHGVMVDKFKSGAQKSADQQSAAKLEADKNRKKSLAVSIPFAGPSEWNGLRARILSTPGVLGLDVSSLAGDGAVVNLGYAGTLEAMQSSLQASGLQLNRIAGVWVVEPF